MRGLSRLIPTITRYTTSDKYPDNFLHNEAGADPTASFTSMHPLIRH
jgi:hypothetical protein